MDSASLGVAVCLSLALLAQVWQFVCLLRMTRDSTPSLTDAECPYAMVLLCLRGGDEFLCRTLHALITLDYPRYLVRIIVDSARDEAHTYLREVLGETPPAHVEIQLLTQRLATCTGKVSSTLQATETLPDGCELVAIIDGDVVPHITNFSARIVSETVFSRFNEQQREFDIEVSVRGERRTITVPADEFDRMNWPITRLGADAIIYPASGAKDEVRAAIQLLSPSIQKLVGIDRLGWHHVNGVPVFVHAGGVIGGEKLNGANSEAENCPTDNAQRHQDLNSQNAAGTISPEVENDWGIRLRIPTSLKRYNLPTPSSGLQLVKDIKASMQLLTLAPIRISFPLYSAIWYALIGEPDFSLHLYGTTGTFKTEYTALGTQHFGAGLDARHLPANWGSTPNFIRASSAHAANVILTVDDLVPTGSQYDIERSFRAAEDVFRSQGNGAGRGRCYRDGTPQEVEPPRCLICSTGEVRPSGHSLTSRVVTIEVNPGDILDRNDKVKLKRFSEAQSLAKSGAYSRVTSAFVEWFASDFDTQKKELEEQVLVFRELFSQDCQHARTADAAAKLLAGFERFLEFASIFGGIDEMQFDQLWEIAHDGLFEVLAAQDHEQADESPVNRFLELLRTALASGRAHLAYMVPPSEEDDVFGNPTFFGYRQQLITEAKTRPDNGTTSDGSRPDDDQERNGDQIELEQRTVFTPHGQHIGWKEYDNLYFEPQESLAVVQRLVKEMHQPPIPLSSKALGKRLSERGLLASNRKDRNVARVNIHGRRHEVFHIRLKDFLELHRVEGDFVDDRDEEALQRHEQAMQREIQAAQFRRARRDDATDFRMKELMKLLPK